MSFRFILSNTTRLAPFQSPYVDTTRTRSAKAQHMSAMIAQANLDNYLGQSMHTHLSQASTTNNEAGNFAFTLNILIAPCIN